MENMAVHSGASQHVGVACTCARTMTCDKHTGYTGVCTGICDPVPGDRRRAVPARLHDAHPRIRQYYIIRVSCARRHDVIATMQHRTSTVTNLDIMPLQIS